jgi:hypothetical protein
MEQENGDKNDLNIILELFNEEILDHQPGNIWL